MATMTFMLMMTIPTSMMGLWQKQSQRRCFCCLVCHTATPAHSCMVLLWISHYVSLCIKHCMWAALHKDMQR